MTFDNVFALNERGRARRIPRFAAQINPGLSVRLDGSVSGRRARKAPPGMDVSDHRPAAKEFMDGIDDAGSGRQAWHVVVHLDDLELRIPGSQLPRCSQTPT